MCLVITFDTEAGDITDIDLRPLFVPFCVAESSLFAPRTLFSLSLAAATIANVLQIIINTHLAVYSSLISDSKYIYFLTHIKYYRLFSYLTGAGDVVASGTVGGAATGALPGLILFPDGFFQAHIR